jgi:ribosomal-protein-alanine N-acetyltransferase
MGDDVAALRVARAAFRSGRTAFSWTRVLVAEDEGRVVGEMARFPGSDWRRLRIPTGLVMLAAAGPVGAVRLIHRGRREDRSMETVPREGLFVLSLAVAPERRGHGIGADLLRAARREARALGLRLVVLDVAARNERAVAFYRREGFRVASEHRIPATGSRPGETTYRMAFDL